MIVFSELKEGLFDFGRLEIKAFDKRIFCEEVGILIAQVHTAQTEKYAEITIFCVKEKYRNQKIGTSLVEHLFEYTKAHGISYISVTPGPCDQYDEGVELTHETQIEIYQKLNFVFSQPKESSQLLESGGSEKGKAGILRIV